jgi:uncharacterized protein YbjQ (UPF0145 family)
MYTPGKRLLANTCSVLNHHSLWVVLFLIQKLHTAKDYAMDMSNTEMIPGKQIVSFYGIVQGSTIRAKHIGRDMMAGFKNIVGGELKGYTELLQESRKQATERMVAQAREMGANAIVNVRYTTSSVAQGASEILAYGTAVSVE